MTTTNITIAYDTKTFVPSPPNHYGLYPPLNEYKKIADELGVPLLTPNVLRQSPYDTAVAVCGECGRVLYALDGYYCGNINCPVQSRVTC